VCARARVFFFLSVCGLHFNTGSICDGRIFKCIIFIPLHQDPGQNGGDEGALRVDRTSVPLRPEAAPHREEPLSPYYKPPLSNKGGVREGAESVREPPPYLPSEGGGFPDTPTLPSIQACQTPLF